MARESKKAGTAGAKKTKSRSEARTVKKKPAERPKATKRTAKPSKAVTKKALAKKAAKKTTAVKKPIKKAAKKTTAKRPVAKKATAKKAVKAAKKVKSAAKKGIGVKAHRLNAEQVIKDFRSVVNLKPDQLERWLSMPDSKKLGFKDEAKAGTIGHESGKRILKILGKRRDKYTEDDLRLMQTVVGFVRQHRREKPPGDVFASNWRYSLMNWGHDPMK